MTLRHKILLNIALLFILMITAAFTSLPQESAQPVVKAVLFWMQGCPHCHEVINTVIPPIQEKYGDQFHIEIIELASSDEVFALYDLAESMGFSKNDVGVPFLIIGEHVLIGSRDIPEQLPGLIDQYLAKGGADFPDSAALAALLNIPSAQTEAPTPTNEPQQTAQATQASTLNPTIPATVNPPIESTPNVEFQTFQGENGFLFAWFTIFLLLGVMAFSAVYIIQNKEWLFSTPSSPAQLKFTHWWLPLLSLVGLGVAAYLAYVETQSVRAFCGPIGDCNTVQSSSYARLFDILPIGVLGVIGYVLIILAWAVGQFGPLPWSNLAKLSLLVMTFGGTLFSVYLTYLEVAVIRAVCMWCVSSALIMAGLLVLSVPKVLPNSKGLRDV